MEFTNTIEIIFDNGGGITVQITKEETRYRYEHTYEDAFDAAIDIIAAERGSDISMWDGNETEGKETNWLNPGIEDIRNGGYRVMDPIEVRCVNLDICSWSNIKYLCEELNDNHK